MVVSNDVREDVTSARDKQWRRVSFLTPGLWVVHYRTLPHCNHESYRSTYLASHTFSRQATMPYMWCHGMHSVCFICHGSWTFKQLVAYPKNWSAMTPLRTKKLQIKFAISHSYSTLTLDSHTPTTAPVTWHASLTISVWVEYQSTSFSTFLTKCIQLTYLPCIKYFGLPISISFPAYRKVSNEEHLSFVSVSKGCASLL